MGSYGKRPQRTCGLRTWVEINSHAIHKNFLEFKKIIGKKCRLMAVAKSNAYGHGIIEFSLLMQKLGTDWIGVDSFTEAKALREHGVKKPILIFGYILPECLPDAARAKVSITVSDFALLKHIVSVRTFRRPLKVHIKIDSGMYRQGFMLEGLPRVLRALSESKNPIQIEGLYTHFAAAKNPAFPDDTRAQMRAFNYAVNQFTKAGHKPIVHACATSGSMAFPESHYDMVRIGIGMYGLWPSREIRSVFENSIKLTPAICWKTVIGETKKIPKGSKVGYDFTEKVARESKIAVCPVGYWHGYRRALSSIGHVLVRGKRAKILGRISMDMITIDISSIPNARVGDEVVLLGKQKNKEIFADELADLSGTINYEIVTQINPRIKRVYSRP